VKTTHFGRPVSAGGPNVVFLHSFKDVLSKTLALSMCFTTKLITKLIVKETTCLEGLLIK